MKIAIIGKMCSGKTTTANMIFQMDHQYEKFSFGTKVKEVAVDLFQMKEKDRTLLTSIGTKMREINPDVWCDYVMNEAKYKKKCIIDDLRYQNEYDACLKNNFIFIKINISPELQEKRIIRLYPNNYQDHLDNLTHTSELTDQLNFKKIDLEINTEEDLNRIKHKLYLLLLKNG
tara:strand:- start:76 stop:597 length:522 start_codon:yes stop_codon:yes gene_type:complete